MTGEIQSLKAQMRAFLSLLFSSVHPETYFAAEKKTRFVKMRSESVIYAPIRETTNIPDLFLWWSYTPDRRPSLKACNYPIFLSRRFHRPIYFLRKPVRDIRDATCFEKKKIPRGKCEIKKNARCEIKM